MKKTIFLCLLIMIAFVIGFLIPIPSPLEQKEEIPKKPIVNVAIKKDNIIDFDLLDAIFSTDIEKYQEIMEN